VTISLGAKPKIERAPQPNPVQFPRRIATRFDGEALLLHWEPRKSGRTFLRVGTELRSRTAVAMPDAQI
jgi:hypothetical protein